VSLIRATWSVHLIRPHLITRIIFGEKYRWTQNRIKNSVVVFTCNNACKMLLEFLHFPRLSYVTGYNISLQKKVWKRFDSELFPLPCQI
jgi:hypothetical protein